MHCLSTFCLPFEQADVMQSELATMGLMFMVRSIPHMSKGKAL